MLQKVSWLRDKIVAVTKNLVGHIPDLHIVIFSQCPFGNGNNNVLRIARHSHLSDISVILEGYQSHRLLYPKFTSRRFCGTCDASSNRLVPKTRRIFRIVYFRNQKKSCFYLCL